jgi:glyoxylase-like metal-dependent hydrolase (beta-lactamase superfamily II)
MTSSMHNEAPDQDTMTPLATQPPAAGSMTPLADDLYWIRFTLPFRLNHINLYAFDTDEGWLLLDCCIEAEDTVSQWQSLLSGPLAGRPVCGIIVSHYHADHVGFAGALSSLTAAPIHMGREELEQARWNLGLSDAQSGDAMASAYARFGLPDETVARTRARGNYYRHLSGDLPADVQIIAPGQEFRTKSGVWKARFDTGHSPAHLSLVDHIRKLHICVDFLLPRISPNISVPLRNIEADMLGHYLVYLQGLATLDKDWLIIPGHDWPYYGGGVRARQLIAHHAARLDQLRVAAADRDLTTADAMAVLFTFDLSDHELFFASCEARAHLNHLVERGEFTVKQTQGIDVFSGA